MNKYFLSLICLLSQFSFAVKEADTSNFKGMTVVWRLRQTVAPIAPIILALNQENYHLQQYLANAQMDAHFEYNYRQAKKSSADMYTEFFKLSGN